MNEDQFPYLASRQRESERNETTGLIAGAWCWLCILAGVVLAWVS